MARETHKKRPFIIGLFWTALLPCLFWGLLAQLDPLGIKTAADLQSESIFIRLIGGPWYASEAQDDITVVLIDDHYLDQIGAHWPMSYIEQDLLLKDILDYNPRAVYIDLLYRHQHGEDADLQQYADTVSKARTQGEHPKKIPIFIPYLVRDKIDVNTCNPDVKPEKEIVEKLVMEDSVIPTMQATSAIKTYVGWAGCGNRYPSYILKSERLCTPAFALYLQSQNKHSRHEIKSCTDLDTAGFDVFQDPMMVRWGTGVSKVHQLALEKAGIPFPEIDKDSWFSKARYLVSQLKLVPGQLTKDTPERGQIESSTYTDTLHATWFLGTTPELSRLKKQMIENRIVLIGTKIEGVHDEVISPTNGKVPGVYLIAMALDNYLEYGSRYFREMDGRVSAVIEISVLFGITFFIGLLWHFQPIRLLHGIKRFGYVGTIIRSFFIALIYKIIIPIIISFLVALLMWRFRYAPMDWIGVSLLSFAANPVKFKDCFQGEKISPFTFFQKKRPGEESV